ERAAKPGARRRARRRAPATTVRTKGNQRAIADDGRSLQPVRKAEESAQLQLDPHLDRVAGQDPVVVARGGEEAGDDQLPDVQARARRALLREDLRSDEGLRVQLRQVQAHAPPWRGV